MPAQLFVFWEDRKRSLKGIIWKRTSGKRWNRAIIYP